MSTIAAKISAPVADEPRPDIDPYPLSPYVAWAGRRNRDPILTVFKQLFPKSGTVLELASGSGAHINYFAPHFRNLRFQPSDYDLDVFDTIRKTKAERDNANVSEPIKIDLTSPGSWPSAIAGRYDVIFVINLFQVAPVAIADGIANISSKLLTDDGFLAIYGPFKVDGEYTTASNEDFDKEILAAKVPEWGLKDVRDIEKAANRHGLVLKRRIDMPANNFVLLFGKA
jgi:cyclopropane fatty-acyl-phospholipid synthase-like methyltransferase